jgi:flagellin-specific chaperone FliS
MHPCDIYQQQSAAPRTQIDLLLALYDGAIFRLERAGEALGQRNSAAALPLLLQAQLIVYALADGVDPRRDEVSRHLLRLYEFALHCLGTGRLDKIAGALRVLRILRAGLEEIRDKAVELELSGTVPRLAPLPAVRLIA